MRDLIRDSTFGQIVRFFSAIFKYPEESADFVLPTKYARFDPQRAETRSQTEQVPHNEKCIMTVTVTGTRQKTQRIHTPGAQQEELGQPSSSSSTPSPHTSAPRSTHPASQISRKIRRQRCRGFPRSLNLRDGYGIGPLFLARLTEIPAVGRNLPYVVGFLLFVLLCIPTALVDDFAGLLVLRFLLGFFGSPALATGWASMSDLYGPVALPYSIALGPIVGNFAFQAKGWRWSTCELPPEMRLMPGRVPTFLIPMGQFIFAWTSRPSIHWFPSLIGVTLSMMGVFIITQCMFTYLPFNYPQYSGSLFATNNFARALLAAGAILCSIPMFEDLGIDGGVSLLGGLTALCCFGIYALYYFGQQLRKRIEFAQS